MSIRVRVAIVVALGAALTASAALAAIQQTYSQKFTSKKPGQSTGMSYSSTTTDSGGGAPTLLKRVTLTIPSGTKINPGAAARCAKPPACPATSQLGKGQATVLVGTATLPLSAVVYNRAGGLVLVVNDPTSSTPFVFPVNLVGRSLVLDVPKIQKGPFTVILTQLSMSVQKIGKGQKAYASTPRTCPKSHAWTFTGKFDFMDGSSKTVTSRSACVSR